MESEKGKKQARPLPALCREHRPITPWLGTSSSRTMKRTLKSPKPPDCVPWKWTLGNECHTQGPKAALKKSHQAFSHCFSVPSPCEQAMLDKPHSSVGPVDGWGRGQRQGTLPCSLCSFQTERDAWNTGDSRHSLLSSKMSVLSECMNGGVM